MTTTTPGQTTLHDLGAEFLNLYRLALDPQTQEAQWQMGMTPTPREDTGERSKNVVSDPTPLIALDGRRLKLRDAVVNAEDALASAMETVIRVRTNLEQAIRDDQDEQKVPA